MGSFTSRQNAAVENAGELPQDRTKNYKFPPRSGNFFGSHFIMGGERFDTSQPESYLFGENADLNFLNRPTAFPYPPPQANEPTKTLKSLVNIRKESVRFVKIVASEKTAPPLASRQTIEQVDGNTLCTNAAGGDSPAATSLYNIEFTFDSDAKCAITIYYFCTEEVSPSGVRLTSGTKSETYHYDKGMNQYFSQPGHIFNPQLIPEDDLSYCPTKEQYPVAIHCVVEEGNEDCRQSHTTICVVDHHDNNSYTLRALKQKIFVDGLCYLLQEIYGIENKAINKSSIDEEIDDHGSECVICMSETRDTLILPCRHLCLCNSCADSLRYQANNCPICRAPFRALLQIRAVQKGISTHSLLHQNISSSTTNEPAGCDQHCPPGYIPVSLIEALNGPPQYVGRNSRHNEDDMGDCLTLADNHKNISPHKPTNQRRNKSKKHHPSTTAGVEVNTEPSHTEHHDACVTVPHADKMSPLLEKHDKIAISYSNQDKLEIVNERHNLKLSKNKGISGDTRNNSANSSHNEAEEDDSDTEKLSPLLSPGTKYKPVQPTVSLTKMGMESNVGDDDDDEEDEETSSNRLSTVSKHSSLKKNKLKFSQDKDSAYKSAEAIAEDTQNTARNSGSLKNASNFIAKKNLQKKSTSVGNIVGGSTSGNIELKVNVSSLPDMLDSNSTSTRSSSDSYSSSSSTKQLLSSNPAAAAVVANIIVDGDKSALQKAVNV